ncbi:MAG: DUF2238 domain-containing protein, partial [Bacteroidales bacterium]|nr:DUF2238 domain-containing protein [Bacteroidales bacterium]
MKKYFSYFFRSVAPYRWSLIGAVFCSMVLAGCSFFFVWLLLQTVGAHYSFERVPMDWLTAPLGLARNPYDRIAHFTVGTFAFPFAEFFARRRWAPTPLLAAFFAILAVVAMAGLWEIVEW